MLLGVVVVLLLVLLPPAGPTFLAAEVAPAEDADDAPTAPPSFALRFKPWSLAAAPASWSEALGLLTLAWASRERCDKSRDAVTTNPSALSSDHPVDVEGAVGEDTESGTADKRAAAAAATASPSRGKGLVAELLALLLPPWLLSLLLLL